MRPLLDSKSFTAPYLHSLGPCGDVIFSLLATITAQDLIKLSESAETDILNNLT